MRIHEITCALVSITPKYMPAIKKVSANEKERGVVVVGSAQGSVLSSISVSCKVVLVCID
jgi:hypothetical protein